MQRIWTQLGSSCHAVPVRLIACPPARVHGAVLRRPPVSALEC